MTAEEIFKTRWRNGFLRRFFVFVFEPIGYAFKHPYKIDTIFNSAVININNF